MHEKFACGKPALLVTRPQLELYRVIYYTRFDIPSNYFIAANVTFSQPSYTFGESETQGTVTIEIDRSLETTAIVR